MTQDLEGSLIANKHLVVHLRSEAKQAAILALDQPSIEPFLHSIGHKIGHTAMQSEAKERSYLIWWARQDLNLGPTDYESAALTAELRARFAYIILQ